jgi:hypothetical protein
MSSDFRAPTKTRPTKANIRPRIDGNEQASSNLSEDQQAQENSGIDGAPLNQKLPVLNYPDQSEVIGNGSAHIEIGVDRINDREGFKNGSGNGMVGQMGSSCVRITAGLASVDQCRGRLPDVPVNPSSFRDAAMCYISQNANVDDEFKLEGINVRNRSCVVTKADEIRVIARSTLKLITSDEPLNSKGRPLRSVGSIQFIAGNVPVIDSDGRPSKLPGERTNVRPGKLPAGQEVTFNVLQPVPRGELLVAALDEIVDHIARLSDTMYNMWEVQSRFNAVLKDHTHFEIISVCLGSLGGNPIAINQGRTSQSPETTAAGHVATVRQLLLQLNESVPFHVTLGNIREQYLSVNGDKSILSRQVKTT